MGAGGGQQQGQPIRRRLLHRHGADDAVGARAVVHHHRLAGAGLDVLADQPGGDVARAARGEGHDDAQRPLLRLRDGGQQERAQGAAGEHGAGPGRCPLPGSIGRSTAPFNPRGFAG